MPILALGLLFSSCGHVQADKEKVPYFRVLWAKDHEITDPATGNLSIALNSPFIYEGIVYAGHNDGKMLAYELATGRDIWKAEDKSAYHAGPVIFKDQIIYGTVQGRVYSRQYLTGKPKYVVDLGASVETEGVLYRGKILFHLRNHQLFCLDAETGKILWAYKRSVPYQTTIQRASRPLVVDNKIFIGFADGYVAAFGIEDGVLLWENKLVSGNKFVDIDATPVMKDGKLFVASLTGPIAILEPNSGNLLRTLDYIASRSPLVRDEQVLIGTTDGELVLLDKTFRELVKKKISKAAISSIVDWKGKLAVATVGANIYIVDPKTLETLEVYHLGHAYSAIFGQMQSLENKLAVLSSRNRLYLFH